MQILEGLNPQQEKAVKHFKGPLLILAGAGSGKTRVLTHRIAWLIKEHNVNPWNILALTFTNKAAGEMRTRVDNIVGENATDIWVSTFHSTCVRILRRHIEALGYGRSFTIYDADDQKSLMREILKYLQLDPKKFKERTILNAISAAKDELINAEQYELRAQGDRAKELYARCYREYEKRLFDSNALDFDDLICKTIQLFEENEQVLAYYQNRFRYIMVDEYQDTNTAQFRFISLMANTYDDDGSVLHNLCVVGDDDQSIYKFRGANIYNILNFESLYPETAVIRLEENYRSTQNILDAANAVIKNNTVRKEKTLWSQKPKGEAIQFTQYFNEYEEAGTIAETIASTVEKGVASYKDFAVLYRTNAQSRVFEEKLVLNNIPYRIVGAVNFYQRREIKDLLAYLRTIDNGMDDISVKRIINVPKRGIGLTTIDRITLYALNHETSFYGALQSYEYIDGIARSSAKLGAFVSLIESFRRHLENPSFGLEDLIREIIEETGYVRLLKEEDSEEANGRIENIEELINKVAAYEKSCEKPTLSGFLEEVALVADIDNVDESNDLVLLMTLHSAKGLEFPYVYLVGMEEKIFPNYAAVVEEDQEELEEERRLCYVGITRAMKKLCLSCAVSRFRNGEQQFNRPSRFITEIPRYLLKESVPANKQKPTAPSFSAEEFMKKQAELFQQLPPKRIFIATNYGSSFHPAAEKNAKQKKHRQAQNGSLFAGNPMISKGFPSATEKTAVINYTAGDRVAHARFGEGVVTQMKEVGGDYQVTVAFDGDINRKMMASFAKLKKL